MDRRAFLTGVLSAMGSPALISLSDFDEQAEAGRKTFCGPDKKRKTNVCTVRLLGQVPFFKARSADPGQCWLACLQMASKFHGYAVPVPNLLRDLYDNKLGKTPWLDLSINTKPVHDDKNKPVQLVLETLQVRAAEAAELLSENNPLIIGSMGHPVLLTSMTYTGDLLGGMTLIDATVLDPAPGKGTRVVSSPDWINVSFATRVSIKKAAAKS